MKLLAADIGNTNVTAGAFLVIVAANLASVIAEAGLNWDLPPDPVEYLLFKQGTGVR